MFLSSTVLYIPCTSSPLKESVSGEILTINGQYSTSNSGLQLYNNSYIQMNTIVNLYTTFSIGFWLNSVNPGLAFDSLHNTTYNLQLPVMSKAVFSGQYPISSPVSSFIIWEECQSSGNNVMKILLTGSTSCTLTSSEYPVGRNNYFWINYNGAKKSFNIYINGIQDIGSSVTGTVPSTLSYNTAKFNINNSVDGAYYLTSRNTGVIRDIVVFNTFITDLSKICEAANNGALYISDSTIGIETEQDIGFIFEDITTSTTTSLNSFQGDIYTGDSLGNINRLDSGIFENKRLFSNINELSTLSISLKDKNNVVIISDGSLKIENASIRV
jgi:hypothetical protein